MAGKILLTREPESVKFETRTIFVSETSVTVGRSSKEITPDSDNAAFYSKVLSRSHCIIGLRENEFWIKDCGSSNGTFINGFRLSKSGQASNECRLYSDDILRFGSPVLDKEKRVQEKCVIARVKLYIAADGEYAEQESRPDTDKLYRKHQNESLSLDLLEKRLKQVTFKQNLHQTDKEEETSDEKETIESLEKRLRRKTNESANLSQNLETIQKSEEELRYRLKELESELAEKEEKLTNCDQIIKEKDETIKKQSLDMRTKEEENIRLSDQLAVKVKEEMENFKVADLEEELEVTRSELKRCQGDAWLLAEKLKQEMEKCSSRDREIERLNHQNNERVDQRCEEELERIMACQEAEIERLKKFLQQKEDFARAAQDEYVNLQHLMTEENETVHQIETELVRLLALVQKGQEEILHRDQKITELEDKIGFLEVDRKKLGDNIETVKLNHSQALEFSMNEKNKEIDSLKSQLEMANNKMESLETKMEGKDLKDREARSAKVSFEMELKRSSNLVEELTRKLAETEKHLDIERAEKQDLLQIINQLQAQERTLQLAKVEDENDLVDKETLRDRLEREQENTKALEDEVIQYKLSISELKAELDRRIATDTGGAFSSDKDQLILDLQERIRNEQEIVAHVQLVQEKEILEKEKQIKVLTQLLNNEKTKNSRDSKYWKLPFFFNQSSTDEEPKVVEELNIAPASTADMKSSPGAPAPARPPRTRTLSKSSSKVENGVQHDEHDYSDDEDTVTFHDALSEEEDILIEELKHDDEDDSNGYRVSDIAEMTLPLD